MAGLNPTLRQSPAARVSGSVVNVPRLFMSWEDWLTFAAVVVAFLSVAFSLEDANWVDNMPRLVPTALAGLVIGLVAARIRVNGLLVQPFVLALGTVVVIAAVQNYADGLTWQDRVGDFTTRMREWFAVVRNGDISNDNLPFVTLVHSLTFLAAYFASWSIFRWHNPWLSLVPGGFVLLSNISFLEGKPSGAFIIFLFAAMLIVSRAHLQKSQQRWKAQGVEYPEWISLNALNLTVMVAGLLIVLAWQVPLGTQAKAAENIVSLATKPFAPLSDDFTRLFHNVDSRKGANLHSFGDTLPIQGNIELGSKVLLEVTSTEAGFLRGTSYDEYTGSGWKATDRESTDVEAGELAGGEPGASAPERETIVRVLVVDGEDVIFTLGIPRGTNDRSVVDTPKGVTGEIERIESARNLGDGDGYNALGSVSTATAEQLRAAGEAYPDWVSERYLQLPDDLPGRVTAFTAAEVRDVPDNAYDQATEIERYLREFPYSLDVPTAPPGRDAVDFLLFDLKTGYFDYQATAMAVMLRTLGVPARVAVGYALDENSAEEGKYTVRKSDAYAWVEVYFPTYGWITFNPTSDRPAGGANPISEAPTTPSTDPETLIPNDLPIEELDASNFGVGESPELSEPVVESSEPPWVLIWSLVAAACLLAAAAVAGMLTWNWGLGGLDGRARLWARAHRLGGWAGLDGPRSETPREWSRRVGPALGKPREAVTLAHGYQESKYGRPEQQALSDEDVAQSYRSLRSAMVARVLRWKRKPEA